MLVLTEHTEHLDAIAAALDGKVAALTILHGRITKKLRATLITALEALPPDTPRVLLATGKLVDEGLSPSARYLGTCNGRFVERNTQQYAGRLHRKQATKIDVRIIDVIDTGHPALLRMWDKRQRGYRAMGYRIGE